LFKERGENYFQNKLSLNLLQWEERFIEKALVNGTYEYHSSFFSFEMGFTKYFLVFTLRGHSNLKRQFLVLF
jgi:hypothetical protein